MKGTIILEKNSFKEIVKIAINENKLIVGVFHLNHGKYERVNCKMTFMKNKTHAEGLFNSYVEGQHQITMDDIAHPIDLKEIRV